MPLYCSWILRQHALPGLPRRGCGPPLPLPAPTTAPFPPLPLHPYCRYLPRWDQFGSWPYSVPRYAAAHTCRAAILPAHPTPTCHLVGRVGDTLPPPCVTLHTPHTRAHHALRTTTHATPPPGMPAPPACPGPSHLPPPSANFLPAHCAVPWDSNVCGTAGVLPTTTLSSCWFLCLVTLPTCPHTTPHPHTHPVDTLHTLHLFTIYHICSCLHWLLFPHVGCQDITQTWTFITVLFQLIGRTSWLIPGPPQAGGHCRFFPVD